MCFVYYSSSLHTDLSHDTGTTDTAHLASASIPLAIVPAYKHLKQSKDNSGNIPQVTIKQFHSPEFTKHCGTTNKSDKNSAWTGNLSFWRRMDVR